MFSNDRKRKKDKYHDDLLNVSSLESAGSCTGWSTVPFFQFQSIIYMIYIVQNRKISKLKPNIKKFNTCKALGNKYHEEMVSDKTRHFLTQVLPKKFKN